MSVGLPPRVVPAEPATMAARDAGWSILVRGRHPGTPDVGRVHIPDRRPRLGWSFARPLPYGRLAAYDRSSGGRKAAASFRAGFTSEPIVGMRQCRDVWSV
ncbi:hypothetical protein GCM10027259_41300 [Micromonospora palomenae]